MPINPVITGKALEAKRAILAVLKTDDAIRVKPARIIPHDPHAYYSARKVRVSNGRLEAQSTVFGYWYAIQAWCKLDTRSEEMV
jgi:hypothetical protein